MTVAYLQHEPTDAEQIVQTLSNHFQIVKKTCLQSLAQENEKGLGTLDLLSKSNSNLRQLKKDLEAFNV